jgi:hypothetical protein
MVSSGKSGGSSSPPNQPTPAGNLIDYGNTSPAASWSGAQNVLPNAATTPMTPDLMSAAWQNPNWGAPIGPPPPVADAGGGGFGGMDAFAQQLLDYNKANQFNQNLMAFGPTRGYAISQMFGPNAPKPPTAQGPTQQLLLQALQQRAGGGGMAGNGRSMASYRR